MALEAMLGQDWPNSLFKEFDILGGWFLGAQQKACIRKHEKQSG
jgi:hypothetical protein